MINAIISNRLLNNLTEAALSIKFGPLRLVYIHFILAFSLSLYGIDQIWKLITFKNRSLS